MATADFRLDVIRNTATLCITISASSSPSGPRHRSSMALSHSDFSTPTPLASTSTSYSKASSRYHFPSNPKTCDGRLVVESDFLQHNDRGICR